MELNIPEHIVQFSDHLVFVNHDFIPTIGGKLFGEIFVAAELLS
jgi:hypothetical protein